MITQDLDDKSGHVKSSLSCGVKLCNRHYKRKRTQKISNDRISQDIQPYHNRHFRLVNLPCWNSNLSIICVGNNTSPVFRKVFYLNKNWMWIFLHHFVCLRMSDELRWSVRFSKNLVTKFDKGFWKKGLLSAPTLLVKFLSVNKNLLSFTERILYTKSSPKFPVFLKEI